MATYSFSTVQGSITGPGGAFSIGNGAGPSEEGISFDDKIRELVLHGLLHLMGHDHENPRDARAMESKRKTILKKIAGVKA